MPGPPTPRRGLSRYVDTDPPAGFDQVNTLAEEVDNGAEWTSGPAASLDLGDLIEGRFYGETDADGAGSSPSGRRIVWVRVGGALVPLARNDDASEQRWTVGDYKISAQGASHGALGGGKFSWLLCDASEIPSVQTELIAFLNGLAPVRPFGTGGAGRPLLPDPRGRSLVMQGTHADVDTIGDSDGLALASRTQRHRHTVNDPGHTHGISGIANLGASGADRAINAGGGATGSNTTGISVGPTGVGGMDAPSHLVVGRLFIRAV